MFSATISERNNAMSAGGSSTRNSGGNGGMSSSHLMQIQRMVAANRQQQQQQQQSQHNRSSFSSENSSHSCKEGRGSVDYINFNNFPWNNNSNNSSNNGNNNGGSSAGRDNNFFPPPHLMNPIGNAATAAAAAAAAASNVSPATFLNAMPYAFKCPECAIPKSSMDDLEIHIKTEHLNWLPFRCPFCSATRASDTQMIEHIHSYHKKNENQYVYVNNPVSKRLYKEMIDRAWHNALSAGAASVAGALSASMRASATNNSSSPSRGGNGSMAPPPLPHNQLSAAMNGSFSNHSNFSSNSEFNSDECGNGSGFSGGGGGISSRGKFSKNIDALAAGLAQRRTISNHHNGDSSNFDGKPVAGATVVAKRSSNTDELLAQLQQQYAKNSAEHNNNNINNGSRTEENRSLENQDEDDDNDVIPLNDDNDGTSALLFGQNPEDDDGNGNAGANGLDDETRVQLSNFFGSVKGSDFDMELANTLSANLFGQSNNGSGGDGGADSDTSSALQNVAALFSASSGRLFDGGNDGGGETAGGGNLTALMNGGSSAGTSGNSFNSNYNSVIRRRAPRGCGNNQSISKKRVLGECSSCHKPVTAGARQMHMFFHLGKDHNTYRFRCKYPDCDVEHYRKDQMENHQSKVHGKIDAEMMEDRSLELYNLCQKMSMDLLGTAGNTPGPTAAKAQVMYDQLQREAELAALRKRKRSRPSSFHTNTFNSPFFSNNSHFQSSGGGSAVSGNGRHQPVSNNFFDRAVGADFSPGSNGGAGNGSAGGNMNKADADFFRQLQQLSAGNSTAPTNKDEIECQSCHKVMLSKTRGFHILWHLNTDLGIIRYGCRYCDFRHDRPQSVSTHGKKEHGDENCIDDSISNYEEEVRSMSKACFGREQLFAKEERRRKIERNNERAALAEQEMLSMVAQSLGTPSVLSDDLAADDTAATLKSDDDSNVDGGLLIDADGGGDGDASSSPPPQLDHHTMGDAPSPVASHPPNIKITFSRLKEDPPSKPTIIPQQRSASGTSLNGGGGASSSSSKRKSTRRFGIRRPKSRKQKEIMAKLREVSMRLGGAQYFKKKSTESVPCEKCGKFNASRLSHHAYSHLEGCDLFLCPLCDLGHFSRDIVMKHLKDFHGSNEMPTDNRMRYAQQIKDAIRECYPSCFVDAPIPTPVDIERLKANLNLSDKALATLDVHNETSASADASNNHVDDGVDDEDLEEEEMEEEEVEEQHQHENDEDSPNVTAAAAEESDDMDEKRKEEGVDIQAEVDGVEENLDEESDGNTVKRPRLDDIDADETADVADQKNDEEEKEEMDEDLEEEKNNKQPTVTTRRAASVRQQLNSLTFLY